MIKGIVFGVIGSLFLSIQVYAQMPSVIPNYYGMDQEAVLEAVQVTFIEETFTKPFMESQKLFESEDEEDMVGMGMHNEIFSEIFSREFAKALAKQDLLGLKKQYKLNERMKERDVPKNYR